MAQPYQAIYVFGDSYSDTGARFLDSNGPTAVGYLAEYMGISLSNPQDADVAGKSINFAASGAVSGEEPEAIFKGSHWCCQGMMDQVEDFAHRVRLGSISFTPQTTLFFIAGGLNDSQVPTGVTRRNLTREIALLKKAGAYHVTLALLPTKIPPFSAVGERLNPAYRELVAELRKRLNIDLQLNHWGSYFDEVLENASHYGIDNTTTRCAGRALFDEDTTPCTTPETYYYFHEGHPSTAVSQIVAEKLYLELVGTETVNRLKNDDREKAGYQPLSNRREKMSLSNDL